GAGGFSDFFETLFGGRAASGAGTARGFRSDPFGQSRMQSRPRAGRNVEHEIDVTLEEAFHGTTRNIQYENGRTIQAHVPRGVRTGSRIRLSGQGQPGAGGGAAGDLYLVVRVLHDNQFKRDGDDLRLTVPVDLY